MPAMTSLPRSTAVLPRLLAAVAALAAPLALAPAAAAAPGTPGNAASFEPALSAGGQMVAFRSDASNLVPGDTNGKADIFLRDVSEATTTRVSVSAAGAQGNKGSYRPSMSTNGRYIAFISAASNLVPGDTNGRPDAFRKDMITGAVVRVSTSIGGAQANGETYEIKLSGDGSRAIFTSKASNLVPGDTRAGMDAFVRDFTANTLRRVSAAAPPAATIAERGIDFSSQNGTASFLSRLRDNAAEQDCTTAWQWTNKTKKSLPAATRCTDWGTGAGLVDALALNGAVATVEESGVDTTERVLTVPAFGGGIGYDRTCWGTCTFDLSAFGSSGVQDLDWEGPGLIYFKDTGQETTLPYGSAPVIDTTATRVAFRDGNQLKLWTPYNGSVVLISQS